MSDPDDYNFAYVRAFEHHRVWARAFDAPEALAERARVIAKVLNDRKELKGVADYDVRELHRLAFMLEAMNQGWTHFGPSLDDSEFAREWRADIENGLAHYVVKILSSPEAVSRLKRLAEVVKAFPLTNPQPAFAAHYHAPRGFEPTLQDGLKAVMLCEFWRQRERMRGTYAGLELPTIGQLDRAIREDWGWKGNDKELRKTRGELGLSGLPRSQSGRRKQGGKK